MLHVRFNPYDPPQSLSYGEHHYDESLVVRFRLDWLGGAAILASLFDAIAIWLYHTNGTGMIGDRVLAPLAAESVFWIPVYRMAIPLLIPWMPSVCRQSFAVFFLMLGVVFGINNLLGHFAGEFVFVENFGLIPTGVVCFLVAFVAFCFASAQVNRVVHPLRSTFAWVVVAAAIEYVFFLLGKMI